MDSLTDVSWALTDVRPTCLPRVKRYHFSSAIMLDILRHFNCVLSEDSTPTDPYTLNGSERETRRRPRLARTRWEAVRKPELMVRKRYPRTMHANDQRNQSPFTAYSLARLRQNQ